MGHMAVGLMVVTGWIEMTQLEMEGCWILWIREVMDACIILVLVQTGIMIVIIIILTKGMIGDTCQMTLRKQTTYF